MKNSLIFLIITLLIMAACSDGKADKNDFDMSVTDESGTLDNDTSLADGESDADYLTIDSDTDDLTIDSDTEDDDINSETDTVQDENTADGDIADEDSLLPDADGYEPSCPNGIKDAGEICDSSTAACSDILGINYSGIASCTDSCMGYDTSGCTADTRTFNCSDKPAGGTAWNAVSGYTQTWNGTNWSPPDDSVTEYNFTGDDASCRYKCSANYSWNGSQCIISVEFRQLGTSGGDAGYAVTTDNSGNILVAGYTLGDLDGNTGYGSSDLFVTKWNADLTKVWTRQLGSTGLDTGNGIATDNDGNVFATGTAGASFDDGTSIGSGDVILIKWDTNGDKAWSKQWGTAGYDTGQGVVTDNSGNIYVAGYTEGTFTDGTSAGGYDAFVTKWNADGTFAWTQQWGTTGDDFGKALAIDTDNNIFVTGYTSGAFEDCTNAGGNDIFLTKWKPDGTIAWTVQWGTASGDVGDAVALDGDGNIAVAGWTGGALDSNTSMGGEDIFVTKWDINGAKAWTRQIGRNDDDRGGAVFTDGDGNIYVSGFATSPFGDDSIYYGWEDVFLTKWNTGGTRIWTKAWGTYSFDYGYDAAMDNAGHVVMTGQTHGNFSTLAASDNYDAFLIKHTLSSE